MLSSERAYVSLGELVKGGVADARVARVVGLADRDPLNREDPKDPRNRRISIVLLRQAMPPAGTPEPPPPQPAEPPAQAEPIKTNVVNG